MQEDLLFLKYMHISLVSLKLSGRFDCLHRERNIQIWTMVLFFIKLKIKQGCVISLFTTFANNCMQYKMQTFQVC